MHTLLSHVQASPLPEELLMSCKPVSASLRLLPEPHGPSAPSPETQDPGDNMLIWEKYFSVLLLDGNVFHPSDVKHCGKLLKNHLKQTSTFYRALPCCLGNAERVQKWKPQENKKLIKLQKHSFLCWGKVEITCFTMPKY